MIPPTTGLLTCLLSSVMPSIACIGFLPLFWDRSLFSSRSALKFIHELSLQASSDPTSDIGIVSFFFSIYFFLLISGRTDFNIDF